MKPVLKIPMADGGTVYVEVEESRLPAGIDLAGRQDGVLEGLGTTFESALGGIRPTANALVTTLRGLAVSPDEIEVEFGLKVDAKLGILIAHSGVEGHFNVRLKWTGGGKDAT